MNIDEMIAVLTAFKNGKDIELDINQNWFSIPENYNKWDFVNHTYRIVLQPKLIPFDYNDDLVGKVIKAKNFYYRGMITAQDKLKCDIKLDRLSYASLLSDFTFLDGKPCGKYE